MKELSEYKDEIFRRGKERKEKNRKTAAMVSVFSAVLVLAAIPSALIIAKNAGTKGTEAHGNNPVGINEAVGETIDIDRVPPEASGAYGELNALLSRVCGEEKTVAPPLDTEKTNSFDTDKPGAESPEEADSDETDRAAENGEQIKSDAPIGSSPSLSQYGSHVVSASDGGRVITVAYGEYAGRYVLSGNVLTLPDGRTVALNAGDLAELNSILKELG